MIRVTFLESSDRPPLVIWDMDHVPRVDERVYIEGMEPKRITYNVNSVTWTSPLSVNIFVSWVSPY